MSNKIRQLEDDLAFKYVVDSDKTATWQQKNITPPTGKLPSENLQDTYKDIGAVLEFLRGGGGEIYNEKGDVIAYGGSPPDLAFAPIISRKAIIPKLEKFLKKLPKKIQNWAYNTNPTKEVVSAAYKGKEAAIRDIASPEGFNRFLNTTGAEGVTSKNYAGMFNLYRNIVRNAIDSASIEKMSPLDKFKNPKTLGWMKPIGSKTVFDTNKSFTFEDVIKPAKISLKSGSSFSTTPIHEATHVGQLQSFKGRKDLEALADQYNLNYNDLNVFIEKFWGNVGPNAQSWELSYADKIGKYLWPNKGNKITNPLIGQTKKKGDPGAWKEYALQPREISARMSEIRYLRNKNQLTKMEKKALKVLEDRERKFFSKKGIDYAVDKLWMAAPATPIALDKDLFKEIKE